MLLNNKFIKMLLLSLMTSAVGGVASAAPVNYTIDPDHTFPSFEADHMGVSLWRGKFNKTAGKVSLDKTAGTGALDVTIDLSSIDFGHDKLNSWAQGSDLFDTTKYPQASYQGKLDGFANGTPSRVVGDLTLHGYWSRSRGEITPVSKARCTSRARFASRARGSTSNFSNSPRS